MRARAVLTLLLAATSACGRAPSASPADVVTLVAVDTLVTAESGILTKPADMVVGANGDLFVLDYGGPDIVRLSANADSVLGRLGGPGAGPGQLRLPLGLAIRGDTVLTTNVGNGRFERLLITGEALPSRPAPPEAYTGRLALNPDGGFVLPTNGADSALARLFDADGRRGAGMGTPVAPFVPGFDPARDRATIFRGEIPDLHRNGVVAVLGPDSTVWVAMNADSVIVHFDARGQLLGRTALTHPAFAAIRTWMVERNRRDSTQMRVYPLLHFVDIKAEGGRLWAVLNMPPGEPSLVVRVGPTGLVERWFTLPGVTDVWRLQVVPQRHALLLSSAESATLFRVAVPDDAWAQAGSE